MNPQLSQLTEEINAITAGARAKFGGLSEAQLNWKPAENSWSVGQCFDHLLLSSVEMAPVVEMVVDGSRKMSWWERVSPLSGFFGRFLTGSMMKDDKKFKAPSKAIVPPSNVPAGVIERFAAEQAKVLQTVEAANKFDWKQTVITSPFLSLITYSLDDAFKLMVEHEKRHVRQAERVMQADGFPKV